ncbi:MAG: dephospho-CoA kinase, partial [Lachnospiraceae bacterium]|nr:dephospho-CoA kinase [Lachnospiraceae bacterium]
YLFIEAALLLENGYKAIVDEMWYIHTDEQVRRDRLRTSRGYSDEKIDSIMQGQLSEEDFLRQCPVVIDNSGTLDSVYKQIDEKLGEDLCQKQ